MGYLIAAELVPNLFFALHAGAWVDRRGGRRRIMIATDLARGALIATIPLAYAFDALVIQQLYVVAFLVGTMTVFFHVSYSSLFVSIVPRESYVEANSFLAGSRAFSFVAGPSVGGILVQVLKAPLALVVDAVSYLVSALFLRSISPEEPPTEEAESGHVVAGVRFVWGNPSMRASLLATATINLFNFIFWALFILYVVRSLHVQPGHARARPRRGRRRRRDRLADHDPARAEGSGSARPTCSAASSFRCRSCSCRWRTARSRSSSRCSSSRSSAAGSA